MNELFVLFRASKTTTIGNREAVVVKNKRTSFNFFHYPFHAVFQLAVFSACIIPLLINFQNNGSDVIVRNLDSALASYKTPKCDSVGGLFRSCRTVWGERCVTSQMFSTVLHLLVLPEIETLQENVTQSFVRLFNPLTPGTFRKKCVFWTFL